MQWMSEFYLLSLQHLAVDWGLNSSQMGWIGSVNSIGMAVGALVFGVFADKVGRKKIFMWTLIIIFSCKWIVCFDNNICNVFNITFLRWNGAWGRTSCCINISF